MVPRVVKFIETENRMVVAKVWGERETGNNCLMGTEFQLGKMKMVRRWMLVMVVQQCEGT